MRKYSYCVLLFCLVAVILYEFGIFGAPIDIFGNRFAGFTKTSAIVFGSASISLMLISFSISMISGRVKGMKVIKGSGEILVNSVVLCVIGTLVSWCFGRFVKTGFNISVAGILIVAVILFYIWQYFRNKKRFANSLSESTIRKSAVSSGKMKYSFTHLYSAMLICAVCLAIFLFVSNDKYVFSVCVASVVVALILWKLIKMRESFLLAFVTTMLHSIFTLKTVVLDYFNNFDVAQYYNFVKFGIILSSVYIICSATVSLADIYSHPVKID